MRIERLDLIRFGPFTEASLALDGAARLTVVWGPNEAGKSSALRALRALLFGIPERTTDDFVHEAKQLRVGAALVSGARRLEVVRRKGRKSTLSDRDGKPLPDDALAAWLGGVDEAQFTLMFGLGHDGLVNGGREILDGKGALSETLFSAGTGVSGVRRLLQELEDEAGALFAPRGQNPRINKAIADVRELRARARDLCLRPETWQDQTRRRDEANERKARLDGDLGRLAGELDTLGRVRDALQDHAEYRGVREALVPLANATVLRTDFAKDHALAKDQLEKARESARDLAREIADLRKEIEALAIPESLIGARERIQAQYRQLGQVGQARLDLPKQQARVERSRAEALRHLHALEPGADLAAAERFRLREEDRAAIAALGTSRAGHDKDLENASARLDELERGIAEVEGRLAVEGEPPDPAELRAAVQDVQREGDLEARRDEAARELERQLADVRVRIARLDGWDGTLEDLEILRAPREETIARFQASFGSLEEERRKLVQEREAARESRERCEREVAGVRGGGEVPREEDVADARASRDAGWKLVRRAWLGGEDVRGEAEAFASRVASGAELPEAYEASVRRADELVDRVRAEAERVEKLSALGRRLEEEDGRMARAEEALRRLDEREGDIEREWRAAWTEAAIEPRRPEEMRGWLKDRADLLDRGSTIRKQRQSREDLERRISASRASLDARLRALGLPAPSPDATLSAAVLRCAEAAEDLARRRSEAEKLRKEIARSRLRLEPARTAVAEARRRLEDWERAWTEALRPLGLGADTSPAAAHRILDAVGRLFECLREEEDARARVEEMARCVEAFETEARTLARDLHVESDGRSAEAVVEALHGRLGQALRDRDRREVLEAQLGKARAEAATAEEQARARLAHLEALAREAGLERWDDAGLRAAERLSEERRRLEGSLRDLRARLAARAGGRDEEEFLRAVAAADRETLVTRIHEKEAGKKDIEAEIDRCRDEAAQAAAELRRMDGASEASDLLQESELILSGLGRDVEEYARRKLARAILQRTLETYRAENQDPVLRRAGAMLSAMTLGSFVSLEADVDDRDGNVLYAVRAGGERLTVEAMSDGTRDQLYLALRLASLERHLEGAEPLPLVLDDILVNFDDDRARATLAELAGIARRTQVLFFTHHRHLVDLARESLGSERLKVVELARRPA